jgi:hypothetical protein
MPETSTNDRALSHAAEDGVNIQSSSGIRRQNTLQPVHGEGFEYACRASCGMISFVNTL